MQTRKNLEFLKIAAKRGYLTAVIIIIVVLLGVAMIVAYGVLDIAKIRKPSDLGIPQTSEDQQYLNLKSLGPSDEINDIENDLDSTNLNDLDQGIEEADRAIGDF